jgi:hypothetical protein
LSYTFCLFASFTNIKSIDTMTCILDDNTKINTKIEIQSSGRYLNDFEFKYVLKVRKNRK